MKTRTITVSHGWRTIEHGKPEDCYRVEKVTDSTAFDPNQMLTKREVDSLCESPRWKVTIVKPTKPGA